MCSSDLISLEETRGTIGKYGMMRKEYLRNHKVARFNILTLQNRLDSHLMEIDSQARQRVDNLMNELLEKDPAYAFICYIDANYVADSGIQGISKDTVLGHHGVGIFWNIQDWTIEE